MRTQITLFLVLLNCLLFAQDGHYTLFTQHPLLLNPSLSGTGSEAVRIGGIYRSQWQQIQAPYTNFGFFADARINNFSLNFYSNQNKAGDKGYKKTNILVGLGYRQPVGDGNNALAFGAQIGMHQIAINTAALNFDNQYLPGIGFDQSIDNQEVFINPTLRMTDINIGVSYHFQTTTQVPLDGSFGLSFNHVNEPSHSSVLGVEAALPRRMIVFGRARVKVKEKLSLEPNVMYSRQLNAREIIAGVNIGFSLTDTSGFQIGIANRIEDAVLFNALFKWNSMDFGIGFDYNISRLNQAAAFNNAIEFSMIYNIPLNTRKQPPADKDEDGVLDKDDDCPEIFGLVELNGCPKELAEAVEQPKGPDFDNDGILDDNDLCPYKFGYAKYQGCNDTDEDGIWDHVDVCPRLPGKIENHGCPVIIPGIDSDADGIPDRYDQCIYIKGLVEFNGCPDTDGDGVSDLQDECPYIKGPVHRKGCPELKGISSSSGERISVDVVEFDTDKHIIKSGYHEMLNRVASLLESDHSYKLVIEGHTDNEGNATYNIQLSKKRANSIRKYLIARGVPDSSISMFHFGENRPKSQNDSAYGKARNRRAELILLNSN
jgi:type IX secretion system PorP/SprF family membrane protein